jgi:transcription antitermination factor NusG
MQKNWYVVYTKPHCEKKVAALLTKRKIDNFCPLNCRKIKSFRRLKILQEPLFKSYVFVNITLAEISVLKQTDGVISMLYWMGEPAVIKEDEIEAIKEFTFDHQNIELERTQIDINGVAHIVEGPSLSIEGNFFALKNKTKKVNLPSLGFNMIAKMDEESIFAIKSNVLQNNSFIHSQ